MPFDCELARVALDRRSCLGHLAEHGSGALGLSVGALPVVRRVHYVLRDGRVLFRVSSGDGVARAVDHTVLALEVNGSAPDGDWSILVQGPSHAVGTDEASSLGGLDVVPGTAEEDRLVVLVPELVSGSVTRPLNAAGAGPRGPGPASGPRSPQPSRA